MNQPFNPYPPQQPPPHAAAQEPAPNNVGLIVAGIWLAIGTLGCLGTGVLGAMSETAGMNASYLGVPLFFGGLGAMVMAPFLRKQQPAAAIGGPIGCGCGGMLFAMVALVVFYQAIWPSL